MPSGIETSDVTESRLGEPGPDPALSLEVGRREELSGRIPEALESYARALDGARRLGLASTEIEALRRLAVLHHLRAEGAAARELCRRSYEIALARGERILAGEALNTLAGFDLERGRLREARKYYLQALRLARRSPAVVAKIEQNLGTLAAQRAEWSEAEKHFSRSLAACRKGRVARGAAISCHNLARLHTDRGDWMQAHRYFRLCQVEADDIGDCHLRALAALGLAEVYLALGSHEPGRQSGETALRLFSELDARRDRAAAHRILGVIFRETGRLSLAESHLRSSLEMAHGAECRLAEARAFRDLARLQLKTDRSAEALSSFGRACDLFTEAGAQSELLETHREEIELQLS